MAHFAVIGLGNFGFYLATHLHEKGHEVMAIDKRTDLVQDIRSGVSQAVVANATEPESLSSLGLGDMDVAVVCIGTSLSDSVLAVLNLVELGTRRIIAKCINEAHGRILRKIGASDIIFPERDQAISLAERLHNPHLLDYLPLLQGYSMVHLPVPPDFTDKTLRELNLINRYGVQVVAVQGHTDGGLTMIPTAQYVLRTGDSLIILGPDHALEKLQAKST